MSPTSAEQTSINAFLASFFTASPPLESLTPQELQLIEIIVAEVLTRAAKARYILGSAVDYLLMAQKLAAFDPVANGFQPELTEQALFERYELVIERNGKKANTLTLRFGSKAEAGMRGFEEKVVDWFRGLGRNYPSAYVYNTGQ